ncbi:uncharacterized mitochondrial protein AtMg00810-like [Malus sylvestris]|uniref:uncharacterized mitochondrial protein AtMg00810-like n=1 Tax=Malus sylvestris TaxID=3752 RepID=UPI0021AC15E7|nr:uncharacterized mitochondrial protein AtMg00810-like [Malus sylvestris]
MVVTCNDPEERAALQRYLSTEFEMKDLRSLKYFLGIEVSRNSSGIFLSQRKYIIDLLHETGMSACQPVATPLKEGLKLSVDPNQVPVDKMRYQREQHMNAVMRILRYLKGSPGKEIFFKRNNHLRVEGYTDADWAGLIDDRGSTSGYFTFVEGNLVTWRSKKQNVVTRSSAEAEYRVVEIAVEQNDFSVTGNRKPP